MIHLGDTADGRRIEIPVHHTGIFGQTGVGKTRALKYMARQAVEQGFAVLIIDSKLTHPEFKGFGKDMPLYLEESTDTDVFRSLIEGMRTEGRGDMNRYRGGFVELCEPFDMPPAASFKQIGERLEAKLRDKAIRGSTRAMYSEIRRDYLRLMKMLGEHEFSKKLEIPRPIARMETRVLSNVALQGLVLKSVINQILREEKDLIILVDEAPNFCNQNMYNPAKSALMALDAQGRSKGLFGWYSGQTLTGFDKKNMKNLWYWLIGREMEPNEAKDAHSVQTYKRLSVDEIRRLGVQEFVAVTPESTDKIRVPDVDANGFLIKSGEAIRHITSVHKNSNGKTLTLQLEDDKNKSQDFDAHGDMYKQKAEVLLEEKARLEERLAVLGKRIQELEQTREEQAILIQEQTDEINRLKEELETSSNLEKALLEFALPRIKEHIMGQLAACGPQTPPAKQDGNGDVGVQDIAIVERRSSITIERIREPVKFAEDSIEGMLCKMMKAGELDGWRTVPNIAKSIANSGGEYSEAEVRSAVEAFAKSPYHLLEQRKNPSSRAWEFRLDKAEAEEALFKEGRGGAAAEGKKGSND